MSAFEGNAGATNLTFTVSLNHASDQSIGVGYATQDGTAKTADSDYSAVSGTLTFSAGETAKTVTVHANGDTLSEPDETFTLGLSGATGATIADASGTGTIRDDDPLPQISVNDVSHAEGNTGQVDHTFTVSLSTVSGQPVSAAYATQDGTATIADSDYAQASGTVTVPTGQTSATVTVKANGDTTFEPDESFALKLSAPSAATISDDTGAGTIQNDDPQPQIAVTDVSHAEGASGQTDFDFTVSLANPSSETVSVDYATQEGSATTADSDYAAASGSLSFDPGQTSKTVTVKANGDAKHEPDESFSLRLSNPVHATISDDTGAGTIQNDDGQPQISIADVSKLEGNTGTTDFAFAVSLSNPTTDAVTVDIASADGSATVADGDYQALAPLTLTFSPGTTQVSASVTANADTTFEGDETFTAELSNPGNATIGDTTGVGTIQNDDTQPQISVNDVGVLEGNSGQTDMTFTVSLSNPSAQAVSVGYATADGTATAGSDYVAASGTVSFDPGQTSKSVVVKATGDTQVENNETFTLNLSGPTGATIADGSGLGSIQNDDSKYPRPKAATPISVALVQAYDDCASPNSAHDGTILPAGHLRSPGQDLHEPHVGHAGRKRRDGELRRVGPAAGLHGSGLRRGGRGHRRRPDRRPLRAEPAGCSAVRSAEHGRRCRLRRRAATRHVTADDRPGQRGRRRGRGRPGHRAGLLDPGDHSVSGHPRHEHRRALQPLDHRQHARAGRRDGWRARDLGARPGQGLRRRPGWCRIHARRLGAIRAQGVFVPYGGAPVTGAEYCRDMSEQIHG